MRRAERRWPITAAAALLFGSLLAGCATQEYGTERAERDLRRAGLSSTEARCVIRRLRAYYAAEYVRAQAAAVRAQDPGAKVVVNPRARDLYVRNKLAGQDTIAAAERRAARAVTAACRASG